MSKRKRFFTKIARTFLSSCVMNSAFVVGFILYLSNEWTPSAPMVGHYLLYCVVTIFARFYINLVNTLVVFVKAVNVPKYIESQIRYPSLNIFFVDRSFVVAAFSAP